MNIDKENRFLNIFNRNLPSKNRYTTDEIKIAFSKESYSSGSLDKYYNKQTAISDNTIKKYFAIADEYIKSKRYKELITGKIEKK